MSGLKWGKDFGGLILHRINFHDEKMLIILSHSIISIFPAFHYVVYSIFPYIEFYEMNYLQ